jgi:hypothetical protein
MPTAEEFRALWQLHLVDTAIVEIRKRAAGLDPGKAEAHRLEQLTQLLEKETAATKALRAEHIDLELQQQSHLDKAKRLHDDLYSGKVVNPREVEAMEKEIASLKTRASGLDDRLVELLEQIPPAEQRVKKVEAAIEQAKQAVQTRRKVALEQKKILEEEYAKATAARPGAVKAISPNLLAQYEAIRKRTGDTAMAMVSKDTTCTACGNRLAERIIESIKSERLTPCESCHRFLRIKEGVV